MASRTFSFHANARLVVALLLFVANAPMGSSQDRQKKTNEDQERLIKRCKPVLVKAPKVKQKVIHLRKGERPSGFTPLVAFQIAASGEVINVYLNRSSGIRDSDDYALNWIQSEKYSARPGCPVIESEADVIIDFR
jgi:hypothetical protein